MSDGTEYQPNPPRGCGQKKKGGYYLESDGSPFGMLHKWVYIHGDGIEGGDNPYAAIPPRRSVYGNLAASLMFGEFVSNDVPLDVAATWAGFPALQEFYAGLRARGCEEALFDHVGSNNYSAYSFQREVLEYGPSRRVTQQMAEELAKKTPIPIVFTHSRIPVFRDEAHRETAVALGRWFADVVYSTMPTWFAPKWGLYARQETGSGHYLDMVLRIVDRLDRDAKNVAGNELYEEAKAVLADARYVEQAFGATWITRVTYVHQDGEDKAAVAAAMAQKGIQTLDLEEWADD